jgi:enoyl-[acyl-carrier protein] reductase II
MGLVPGSLGIDEVREDIRRTRDLTDKPFGLNLPLAFVKDIAIVDMIVEEGVRFVTTSAGSPTAHTPRLKEAGLTVFHVVPSLRGAQKAIDAGVDGLVVEGSEGAGFKAPREVSSMVLLPLVASQVGVPIIAAGRIADGRSMAAAFALGAEGVQMGTRMVATVESGVHVNMKNAVVSAAETDTMLINKHNGKQVRVLRTTATAPFELATEGDPMALLGNIERLYRDGDVDASLAQSVRWRAGSRGSTRSRTSSRAPSTSSPRPSPGWPSATSRADAPRVPRSRRASRTRGARERPFRSAQLTDPPTTRPRNSGRAALVELAERDPPVGQRPLQRLQRGRPVGVRDPDVVALHGILLRPGGASPGEELRGGPSVTTAVPAAVPTAVPTSGAAHRARPRRWPAGAGPAGPRPARTPPR